MAKAFKCDRCGSYYTIDDFPDEAPIKSPIEDENKYWWVSLDTFRRTQQAKLDLCPECTTEINEFLNKWPGIPKRLERKGR